MAPSLGLTPADFYLWGAAKSAVCHDRPRTLNELKTAINAYIKKHQQRRPAESLFK
jgi:hypothetical protein